MRKSFNIMKFAPNRAEEYAYSYLASRSAEIYADGGIIQRPDYVYEWLKLCFELGRIAGLQTPLQIRRKYNALGGVKLNGISNTNLALRSNTLNTAPWSLVNATGTGNVSLLGAIWNRIAPNTTPAVQHRIDQVVTNANVNHTLSFYAVADGYRYISCRIGASGCAFDLQGSGAMGVPSLGFVATMQNLGNGIFFITCSGLAGANTTIRINVESSLSIGTSFAGDGTSAVLVRFVQFQSGDIATDYIPTEGTTASATQSYVQTLYDFGTTSDARVDALQTTAANQPYYDIDSDLPTGIRAPRYDGSNDFMSVNDLGIFNAQTAGTLIAVAKDTNRSAGDTNHRAIVITNGVGGARAVINTRNGASVFGAQGRRLDADAIAQVTAANGDGLAHLVGEFVWGGNLLTAYRNGVSAGTANFSSGAGTTSATDSTLFNLGATSAGADRLAGLITEVQAGRIVLTSAQLAAFRALEKAYYPALP